MNEWHSEPFQEPEDTRLGWQQKSIPFPSSGCCHAAGVWARSPAALAEAVAHGVQPESAAAKRALLEEEQAGALMISSQ